MTLSRAGYPRDIFNDMVQRLGELGIGGGVEHFLAGASRDDEAAAF